MGFAPRLDNKSRMSREVPVRFCEGLGVRFPRATRLLILARTKSEASRALQSLAYLAQKAGLELKSTECSPIFDLRSGEIITTLGMDCGLTENGTFKIRPSERSIEKFLFELKELNDGDNIVACMFRKIIGWISQQSLAYDKSTAIGVIKKVIAIVKERQLQNAIPQLFDEADGFSEYEQSWLWELGNGMEWLRCWQGHHRRIEKHLNLDY